VIEPDQPTTIAEVLQRTREAYAAYQDAIAAFDEARLTVPNSVGGWSVRDVIAHVGADQQWMAGQLEALQAGEEPKVGSCYGDYASPPGPDIDMSTQDGRNAWQRERLAGLSLAEARELAEAGHARLIAAIESFSDEDLTMPLAIGDLGLVGHVRSPRDGEEFAPPLWQWLRGVTWHHYADHTKDLREAAG